MTEQEIIEGNKLILSTPFHSTGYAARYHYNNKFLSKVAKFHESWDWLHPVIERIALLGMEDEYYHDEAREVSTLHLCIGIEAAYKAVIKFLKFYQPF